MNTSFPVKIADKVKASIKQRGLKKKVVAEQIGICRQTFDTRLKTNWFEDAEIIALKRIGVL